MSCAVYPSLCLMCLMCVTRLVRVRIVCGVRAVRVRLGVCVCVCVRACARVCLCVCVNVVRSTEKRKDGLVDTNTAICSEC